ncbi:undecaprenyl-diphosphate phosphatase [Heliorestis acidaminivorans]|uniref:Undecaprenyl-diphosphatase n=1 Tax=Heliorestis acidaminivorans TaxID=553427 RepID=A0A6I0ERP1_9FIRM|nr:undecaprenyl-diphosphate phosphatase [Heliorestis acidaminivorans]KAB2952313.1 undecaprenyl-diphosphate phosphatase [Heliorestis acidaminivorans]
MENLYLVALILAIVEGFTEFLPVSSTGHLILLGHLLGFDDERAATFEIFIQLGAILSVLFLYKEKFIDMGQLFFKQGLKPPKHGFSVLHLLAALIPALLLGYLLHGFIKDHLFSEKTVIIGLVVGALLLLVADRYASKAKVQSFDDISLKQAFSVGLFQCLSLWPGFSRSGATISGGILVGLSPKVAAELSFIVAVPIMFAATGYDLLKSYHFLTMADIPIFALGFVVAFFVAWLSIMWFLRFLENVGLAPFAYYRFILAAFYWIFFL